MWEYQGDKIEIQPIRILDLIIKEFQRNEWDLEAAKPPYPKCVLAWGIPKVMVVLIVKMSFQKLLILATNPFSDKAFPSETYLFREG